MSRQRPLRGACSCGRNHYSVVVPTDSVQEARIFFDDSREARQSQASILNAWLRVPLDWVTSTTVARFSDETHATIRKTFTPENAGHCKRVFCGYCGTHLSYWSERPPEDADYLNITLGSLNEADLQALDELDLLPDTPQSEITQPIPANIDGSRDVTTADPTQADSTVQRSSRHGRLGDLDWFEEMIDGSRLGRTQKTRRGMGTSADGSTTVQWEVSEWVEGDAETSTPTKRKIGAVSTDDVNMRG